MFSCSECKNTSSISINTYKRKWHICNECGSGTPKQKKFYALQMLPLSSFNHPKIDPSEMYNYFTDRVHVEYSKQEAAELIKKYVSSGHLSLKNKRILDISGGNGIVLKELLKEGATGVLTEYNSQAVEFAKSELGLDAIRYDMNQDDITKLVDGKFDVILLRACIMFCEDLPLFIKQLKKLLNKNGVIFVQYAVYPTLGTLLRTQFDEFSYMKLRSFDVVKNNFLKAGFTAEYSEDEIDPSPYSYDHDKYLPLFVCDLYYEFTNILNLRKQSNPQLRSRSRNRGNFIFKA